MISSSLRVSGDRREPGLSEVMRSTSAARDFTSEEVDDATLHRVLDAARHAPSGGNQQPWTVIIIRDGTIREALRDLVRLGWREYAAHLAAGVRPFAPGTDGRWPGPAVDLAVARETDAPWPFIDELHTVPVLLLVTVHLPALAVQDVDLDRQSIVGGASVYPFVHNILLAAGAHGLGGVMTTFICRQEPAVRSLLGIPSDEALAALVVLGHPLERKTRLRRRPVEAFTRIDSFDGPPFAVRDLSVVGGQYTDGTGS
jgi:nitroreductase